MKAQSKCFADRMFESVSSDSFDIYKITSPLAKIIEVSEKSSDRFVGGVVVNDTINNTINNTISDTTNDTINLLLGNKHTVFDKMQAQIKRNLTGVGP